jgi:hypothetical protein
MAAQDDPTPSVISDPGAGALSAVRRNKRKLLRMDPDLKQVYDAGTVLRRRTQRNERVRAKSWREVFAPAASQEQRLLSMTNWWENERSYVPIHFYTTLLGCTVDPLIENYTEALNQFLVKKIVDAGFPSDVSKIILEYLKSTYLFEPAKYHMHFPEIYRNPDRFPGNFHECTVRTNAVLYVHKDTLPLTPFVAPHIVN